MPKSTRFLLREFTSKGYRITIGDYTYGAPSIHWSHDQREKYELKIGSFCSIAAGVAIYVGTQGRHPADFLSTFPIGMIFGPLPAGETSSSHIGDLSVRIGSDVWIGRDVLIQAGVSIGHGAVIGARALVIADIPPYSVAIGTPARPIRKRFDDSQIERLLKLRWWEIEANVLKANIDLFRTSAIDEAIKRLEQIRSKG